MGRRGEEMGRRGEDEYVEWRRGEDKKNRMRVGDVNYLNKRYLVHKRALRLPSVPPRPCTDGQSLRGSPDMPVHWMQPASRVSLRKNLKGGQKYSL